MHYVIRFTSCVRLSCFILFFSLSQFLFSQTIVLQNAHSHNDYKQKHPLTDALTNGFTSIEADVFLIRGKLIISHHYPIFKKCKTLEELYLKPLYDSIIKHTGTVYLNYKQPVILLVEFKQNANKGYAALKTLLEKYKTVLTHFENGVVTNAAVTIVITGHKPDDELKKEQNRFAFIDDDLLNMNKGKAAVVYQMASTKYSNVLKWLGEGAISIEQKQKLEELVNDAHRSGKKVRLWASPENTAVWEELLNCGVDLINTDELEKLKRFLIQGHKK